jgi:PAS domain S-box-containing protein
MSFKIRILKLILLLNIVILPIELYSNGNSLDSSGLKKIRLQLHWKHQFQFAGYYAAIEKGFYKAEGLEVVLIEANSNEEPAISVFKGKAEFGVTASDIIVYKSEGYKPVILATIFQHSPQIILASKQSGIESVHDLAGKRLMMEPHAADVMTYMTNEGIPSTKCRLYKHTFDVNQLLNGEVDAITAYITDEPFILSKKSFDYSVISPLSGGIDFYGDLLFTDEEILKKNPELVNKFLKASLKGWEYALKNKNEIIDYIFNKYSKRHSREHLMYEANKMDNLIMANVVEIGYTNIGRINNIIQLYKDNKMIKDEITSDGLLYSEYLNHKSSVNWLFIGILFLVIAFVSIILFIFYRLSVRLKNEIRDHKIVQEFLTESRETYRLLTESMKDVFWILDAESLYFTYVSPSVESLRGFTPEEILSEPMDASLTSEDSINVRNLIKNGIVKFKQNPGKDDFITEIHQLPCKDGSLVWTEVITKYHLNLKTNRIEIHGVARDITERKKAEMEFRKLSAATEQSPASIVITDLVGNIEYVNPKFTDLTGYSRDEVYGQNPKILKSGKVPVEKYNNLWKTLLNGDVWRGEFENRKKNGDIYYEFAVISPIKDENGIVTHYLAVKEDITERKIIENALKESEEKLKELNSTKDKFFSIIAHDLRNPLGSFKGMTEMLSESYNEFDEEERLSFLQTMKVSADNIFKLLENLLEWSRSQRGTIKLEREDLDLRLLINNNIELSKHSADNKKIILFNNISQSIIVNADANLINTIIRNLISNAIKFTQENGKIVISARSDDAATIVSVRDSGIGMSSDTINKLFKIEQNITTLGTSSEKGTGLGLILSKEFIEKHGGEIWVESEVGKGSTFSFSIPK